VFIISSDGSWLGMSVCIDRITQISSAQEPTCGKISQTLEPVIAARRVRALRPDAQGRFETQGLRPGRYVATALESLEDGRQFDPAFREELRRRGETFDLRDGGTVALDLTVASGL
jgi:hypothetical protein